MLPVTQRKRFGRFRLLLGIAGFSLKSYHRIITYSTADMCTHVDDYFGQSSRENGNSEVANNTCNESSTLFLESQYIIDKKSRFFHKESQ